MIEVGAHKTGHYQASGAQNIFSGLALAGLNFFLGNKVAGGINHQLQDKEAIESTYIQQNPPVGPGLGYKLLVERRVVTGPDTGDIIGNASVRYKSRYAVYSADYRKTAGQDYYDLNISGSVAL